MERVLTMGHTFAMLLHKRFKPESGEVFILSPDPLDSSQVLQFDFGHFPQEPVPGTIGGVPGKICPLADSNDEFAKLVCEMLDAPQSICLMENYLFSADDSWLQRAKSCVVTHESEILHAVFGSDHSQDKIAEAIIDARRIPVLIGAVGRLTTEANTAIQKEKTITTSVLESIAETARLVFVGAYDGEGFVIWKTNPR
jgi:hypothetical protein